MRSKVFVFLVIMCCIGFIFEKESIADANSREKMSWSSDVKLTLENEPKIGEVTILKLNMKSSINRKTVNIICGIPAGVKLITDKNYPTIQRNVFCGEVTEVTLWSGSLKKNELKEFFLNIYIPDGKRYIFYASAGGSGEVTEIDLGQPEPPEWKSGNEEKIKTKEGKRHIRTDIKKMEYGSLSELTLPEDELPPIRTELTTRTKYDPSISMPYNPDEIPFRYLVYTEVETKETKVTVELPQGIELIDKQEYELTKENGITSVNLFQGTMGAKESKAFYFKVRVDTKQGELFMIKGKTSVLTLEGEEFFVDDQQKLNFGRILY